MVVGTGQQLIVWGGAIREPFRTLADGAAYDPGTRRWTPLPPAPEGQWLEGDATAFWTGRELLVGGVQEAEAGGVAVAGYDPVANRWRRLPQSPGLTGGSDHLEARSAIWSGNRLLVWSSWSETARAANHESGALPHPDAEPDGIDLWAYDPAGDRWTVLPAPPAEVRRAVVAASMTWTGGMCCWPRRGW